MSKKLNILLVTAFLTAFINSTDNMVFAQDDEGNYVSVDEVDLSNEQYESPADKGQVKDLKGRLKGLKQLRKTVAGNLETAGDDIVDNTSLLSDIDNLMSDIENAEFGELTQGEYLELVKDHSKLIDTVKKYQTEMELASERGDLELTQSKDEEEEKGIKPVDIGETMGDDESEEED